MVLPAISSYTKYSRTIEGRLRVIYSNQVKCSKTRKHARPEYSSDEFVAKFKDSLTYLKLFAAWKRSGYKTDLAPTFDRADNSKGYSFDNLRGWVPFYTNWKRARFDAMNGDLGNQHVPVAQLTLEGEPIQCFRSISEAARMTGANNIHNTINGILKSSGGFRWAFI